MTIQKQISSCLYLVAITSLVSHLFSLTVRGNQSLIARCFTVRVEIYGYYKETTTKT